MTLVTTVATLDTGRECHEKRKAEKEKQVSNQRSASSWRDRRTNKKEVNYYMVSNFGNGNLPTVEIRAHNGTCRALVDTGAEVSLIQSSTWHRLFPSATLSRSSRNIVAANGISMRNRGNSEVMFMLDCKNYSHTFTIVDDLRQNIILGMDFLKKANGINFRTGSLIMEDLVIC